MAQRFSDISRTGPETGPCLEDVQKQIDELPLLPAIVTRMLALDLSADDYFEQVVALAREDPPFAIRILKLANSAASSPVAEIDTIQSAVTRLGIKTIRGLITSMAVMRVFVPVDDEQTGLWRHSIETAVGAATIARLVPELDANPEIAYVGGLLHDIGRFVMFELMPRQFDTVGEANWSSVEQLLEAEQQVFHFTHSELGYLACTRWGVPELITEVVGHHHSEFSPGGTDLPHDVASLVLCIQIADQLSIGVLHAEEMQSLDTDARQAMVAGLCLRPEWQPPPVPVRLLVDNVDVIRQESADLLADLGLH